jgi:hypothetical protein
VTIAEPRGGESLRPRNNSVPSYRPTQYAWLSVVDSPVSARLGGGAAHATGGDHRRLFRSQSGCPINRAGSGIHGLGVPWRSQTQPGKALGTRATGSSLLSPVRRWAHPLCSLRSGGISPYRKPPDASAYSRLPGPVDAPECSGLCLYHVFSPSGPKVSGPGGCYAGRAWPLRKRPT